MVIGFKPHVEQRQQPHPVTTGTHERLSAIPIAAVHPRAHLRS